MATGGFLDALGCAASGTYADSSTTDYYSVQRRQLYANQEQQMQQWMLGVSDVGAEPKVNWGKQDDLDEDYIELKQQEEVKLHNSLFEE